MCNAKFGPLKAAIASFGGCVKVVVATSAKRAAKALRSVPENARSTSGLLVSSLGNAFSAYPQFSNYAVGVTVSASFHYLAISEGDKTAEKILGAIQESLETMIEKIDTPNVTISVNDTTTPQVTISSTNEEGIKVTVNLTQD